MTYLLDTDICSYIIKKPSLIRPRMEKISAGEITISSITWAELNSWVKMSSMPEKRLLSLQKMFAPITILPFNQRDAEYHGEIRTQLERKGQLIGALDLLIAAHALSRDLTVVTNNTNHFSRVANLKVVNWTL